MSTTPIDENGPEAAVGAAFQAIENTHTKGMLMSKTINNVEWIDLACSICKTVIATVSAPLPDVPVKCQQCRRDPGCASWCPRGDGHPDELFDADRICYGDGPSIPMTIEPSPGLGVIASIEVSPLRRPGGRDSVYLNATQRHGDTDMDLTAGEARQLAAVLLQIADIVDAD
ncbi:hypothetical protein K8O92_16050 [Nocardia asteroides]|nr:hypothetical protein K8O92_16050 [Nocardia asteroides]